MTNLKSGYESLIGANGMGRCSFYIIFFILPIMYTNHNLINNYGITQPSASIISLGPQLENNKPNARLTDKIQNKIDKIKQIFKTKQNQTIKGKIQMVNKQKQNKKKTPSKFKYRKWNYRDKIR